MFWELMVIKNLTPKCNGLAQSFTAIRNLLFVMIQL